MSSETDKIRTLLALFEYDGGLVNTNNSDSTPPREIPPMKDYQKKILQATKNGEFSLENMIVRNSL